MPASVSAQAPDASLSQSLDAIRVKYHLPALAAALFTVDGLVEESVAGVRRAGSNVPATAEDCWHLGSDTKAMTATVLATYVNEGSLSWDSKVISFFPEFAETVPESVKAITLDQILSHRAGMKENLDWNAISAKGGPLSQQRLTAVKMALEAPAYEPGAFHYSNTDYVIAGAILEKVSGRPWEKVIAEKLFEPLQMKSAGFGGLGTPGRLDQPWPHLETGVPMPGNGPNVDNPEVMGPAGTVHCTMADWTKFLVDQLRGASGLSALLPGSIYQAMQTPHPPGADYGYGWLIAARPWAGGIALTHEGSNTMNVADCWLAPQKKFGVLACTNEGGDSASKACDEAVSWLVQRYLAQPAQGLK